MIPREVTGSRHGAQFRQRREQASKTTHAYHAPTGYTFRHDPKVRMVSVLAAQPEQRVLSSFGRLSDTHRTGTVLLGKNTPLVPAYAPRFAPTTPIGRPEQARIGRSTSLRIP